MHAAKGATMHELNGAEGISDTEGKAATGSCERAGKRASFKLVSEIEAPVHDFGFYFFFSFRNASLAACAYWPFGSSFKASS